MELVKELPEIFEEFDEERRKSFLRVKELKDQGKIVIGAYCSFFPQEIAKALGAVPIALCSYSNDTIDIAEQYIPKSVCPLVKSSYGFAVTNKCPYFYFSDLIVGETTCDCKKKMYEMMAEFKDVYVIQLPNFQTANSLRLWRDEMVRFKEFLEERYHTPIIEENLRAAIREENEKRRALQELYEVMKLNPPPIMGEELLKVLFGNKYQFDTQASIRSVRALTRRILEEYQVKPHMTPRPRILITGCPMGGDSTKVLKAIENNGGIVVGFENCTGAKTLDQLVDENNPDVYEAIGEKYLNIGCAIMSPNNNRLHLLSRMIDEYRVDGVVDMVLSGCHPVHMESASIRNFVNEEKHIPYIDVVTDFSGNDVGQLNTRLGAFVEMLK